MRIPLSLIRSFLPLSLTPSKIAEALTLLGIEVDRIYSETLSFSKIVVGEIQSSKKHPQADTLAIVEVSDGQRTYTVVSAAPNCKAGIKVPFAGPGAQIIDRDGMVRKIESCTIKGVHSEGMLCSAQELQLLEEGDRLLELPQDMKTGTDLASLAWDPVFELSLTPNLGHCMSGLGIARELSASLQIPIQFPATRLVEKGKKIDVHVNVVNSDLCPRYMCRLIEGIKVGDSPFWLKRAIESCGMKSINNVVDAANYIMLKLGQPLHAFDYDKIQGKKIHVAPLEQPQTFKGLDGIERELSSGTIAISDSEKVVAIAGILGGENSAVSATTANILLEAAVFDPISIRVASREIGLRTESSQRFEKGIDPIGLERAFEEACALILQLCGGTLAQGAVDKKITFPQKLIRCRGHRVNQILGTQLSLTEIEEILERLLFKTKEKDKEILLVETPLFRSDISEEIDLIEEVARVYGYNHIEKKLPKAVHSLIANDPIYLFENELRQRLASESLQEFLSCDLISPKLADIVKEISSQEIGLLKTLHSKSEEYSVLRPSLLPALLQVVQGNISQKNLTLHGFEIGRIHFLQNGEATEVPMLAILLTGKSAPHNWSKKGRDVDFYDIKGILENLLDGLQIRSVSFIPSNHISFHPSRQANLQTSDRMIGSFGEIHPALLEKFDIKQRVYYSELNIESLLELTRRTNAMTPLPLFPSSQRDWTLPLSKDTLIDTVFTAIRSSASSLLEKSELIDIYTPEGGTQKNATFRFTYRDPLKTVSFEEVEAEHSRLMHDVLKLLAK